MKAAEGMGVGDVVYFFCCKDMFIVMWSGVRLLMVIVLLQLTSTGIYEDI